MGGVDAAAHASLVCICVPGGRHHRTALYLHGAGVGADAGAHLRRAAAASLDIRLRALDHHVALFAVDANAVLGFALALIQTARLDGNVVDHHVARCVDAIALVVAVVRRAIHAAFDFKRARAPYPQRTIDLDSVRALGRNRAIPVQHDA